MEKVSMLLIEVANIYLIEVSNYSTHPFNFEPSRSSKYLLR